MAEPEIVWDVVRRMGETDAAQVEIMKESARAIVRRKAGGREIISESFEVKVGDDYTDVAGRFEVAAPH